jgi:predicted nucleotidyltransferase
MQRDEVLKRIAANHERLCTLGVKTISIFGSVARDAATERSDVDVLVEFSSPTGLFGLVRLQRYLEELLGGVKVDLTTPGALRSELREQILREAVRAA